MDEHGLKQAICDVGRRMYDNHFLAANDGNISVRVGPGRFLCTPTGVSKGWMTPADIAVVDDQGRQLEGQRPRTSEILLHLEIYHALPEVHAVCHAHPPHATAFAVAGLPLPAGFMPEAEVLLGPVPLAEYHTPGSEGVARSILPHLKNKANTILLAHHGVVACDKTLEQAYFHLETADMYARILLLAQQVGTLHRLNESQMRELLAAKGAMGLDDPRLGHPAAPLYIGENFPPPAATPAAVTLDDRTLERLADMVAERLTRK